MKTRTRAQRRLARKGYRGRRPRKETQRKGKTASNKGPEGGKSAAAATAKNTMVVQNSLASYRVGSCSGSPLTLPCHPLIIKLHTRHSQTWGCCHQILRHPPPLSRQTLLLPCGRPTLQLQSALVQMRPCSRESKHLIPPSQAAHQDPLIARPTVPAAESPHYIPRLSQKLQAPGVITNHMAAPAHRGESSRLLALLTQCLPLFARVEYYAITEQAVKFATV